jgi:AAA domain
VTTSHRTHGDSIHDGSINEPNSEPALRVETLADICAEVDAAGPRRWLVRGIWPSGAYGVHAAEMKAQKTWNALDLAVSVASGTAWLNTLPVDDRGAVVVFAGEGGKGSIVRRIRAICTSRTLHAEDLPIHICVRAPHLADNEHLALMASHLDAVKPTLVILDPLYLALGGADGRDLYAMGRLLEAPQHICEKAGAALFVVTHFNRREGNGPSRFTGAGPAEWGRVLIGSTVVRRSTDPTTLATTVISDLSIVGGEIPDQEIRIKRTIAADDHNDIDSPLNYIVERVDADDAARDQTGDWKPTVLMGRVITFLEQQNEPVTRNAVVKAVTGKREYILKAIVALITEGTIHESGSKLALTKVVPESGSSCMYEEPGTSSSRFQQQVVPGTTGNHQGTGNRHEHREAA